MDEQTLSDDMSILYVEDDETTREEISLFLARRARRVLVAKDGEEGLDLFRRERPDIVVTDVRMPVMDGLRMSKEIRAMDRDAQIIVMTAHSDSAYMMDAIDTGVDRYVLKPVETGKLLEAIGRCAEVVEARKAAARHQEEREKLIGELQEALSKVKLLSGLLPICACCKKVRDDKGYWQQIESYIHDHSEAEFSHGICPDCAKKYYAEYLKPK